MDKISDGLVPFFFFNHLAVDLMLKNPIQNGDPTFFYKCKKRGKSKKVVKEFSIQSSINELKKEEKKKGASGYCFQTTNCL
jgi:hypothetical protein